MRVAQFRDNVGSANQRNCRQCVLVSSKGAPSSKQPNSAGSVAAPKTKESPGKDPPVQLSTIQGKIVSSNSSSLIFQTIGRESPAADTFGRYAYTRWYARGRQCLRVQSSTDREPASLCTQQKLAPVVQVCNTGHLGRPHSTGHGSYRRVACVLAVELGTRARIFEIR